MYIIGAGMAGLIAANYWRKRTTIVVEAQSDLPHNHEALLRFRTPVVAAATGLDFRKIHTRKFIAYRNTYADKPNPYLCNMYSQKVSGMVTDRSCWNLEEGDRYIAPKDFIRKMVKDVNVQYNYKIADKAQLVELARTISTVSTMPMPVLMDIMGWPKTEFEYRPIWTFRAEIQDPKSDVCQTLYFPDLDVPYYRASIVENVLIIEFVRDPNGQEFLAEVLDYFGLDRPMLAIGESPIKCQRFGKILPIDEDKRLDFIYTMSRDYNIYSLGRFATWRNILLDDVCKDITVIDSLIKAEGSRKGYKQSLVAAKQ